LVENFKDEIRLSEDKLIVSSLVENDDKILT